jgi:hypothetical protein
LRNCLYSGIWLESNPKKKKKRRRKKKKKRRRRKKKKKKKKEEEEEEEKEEEETIINGIDRPTNVPQSADAGLLARSQYLEGPATGHPDTGFSWFPCVYKRMLRWFQSFQVATTFLSCSPPDLNFLVTFFLAIFVYM